MFTIATGGAWILFKKTGRSTEDLPIDYHVVLKVTCADDEHDFLHNIPRNRPLEWKAVNDKIVLQSGSAHVDGEGYARFVVSALKPSQVKKIKVFLNSEEKEIDRDGGPFNLMYKRKTCSTKASQGQK